MNEPSANPASESYDPKFFDLLDSVEDRHFWFRARRHIIRTLVRRIAAEMAPGYLALEAGCGNGSVLQALEQACPRGTVFGMDLFLEGLRYARKRTSCSLIQGDVDHLPFQRQFDLIGCFDVLEHQADDLGVLRSIRKGLTRDGVLVLTVPAHPYLWSYFDVASCHYRRYEIGELESKLSSAGYRVEYVTQFMTSIFPLIWLRRRLNPAGKLDGTAKRADASRLAQTELRVIPVVNSLLCFLLFQEARLILRRRRLPLGTSLLAVARPNEAVV